MTATDLIAEALANGEPTEQDRLIAASVARHPKMQAMARQAVIGAAVERLPHTGGEAIWLTRDIRGQWEAQVVYPMTGKPKLSSMFEDSIPEAIAAALDPEAPTDD